MRRVNRIGFAAIILVLQLLSTAPLEARAPVGLQALYRKHVSTLASEKMGGRKSATPGAVLARKYLIDQFGAIGLKPAFKDSYRQQFPMILEMQPGDQKLSGTRNDKQTTQLRHGRDFKALASSRSSSFSGQAVFIGYAISNGERKFNNFGQWDKGSLKGKVAVAFRYEPHHRTGQSKWTKRRGGWTRSASLLRKAYLAAHYGASALLVVNPPAHSKASLTTYKGISPLKTDIPVLNVSTDAFKRMLGGVSDDPDKEIALLLSSANAGTKPLGDIPGLKISGKVSFKPKMGESCNIAAKLEGRGDLAGEVIIVGAHWDHIGRVRGAKRGSPRSYNPGADDNASGAAGILILAKQLAKRDKINPPKHRRTIILTFFGAEEAALIGSTYLAKNLKDFGLKRSQIVAMVNLDMIGRMRNNTLYAWSVDLAGQWDRMIRRSARGSGLNLKVSGPGMGLSDHRSFYYLKMPVVSLTTGLHPDIHRPSDTIDKINFAGAIKVLNVTEKLIGALSVRPEAVPYEGPGAEASKPKPQGAKRD
jgi:aminopeptidase YwaD